MNGANKCEEFHIFHWDKCNATTTIHWYHVNDQCSSNDRRISGIPFAPANRHFIQLEQLAGRISSHQYHPIQLGNKHNFLSIWIHFKSHKLLPVQYCIFHDECQSTNVQRILIQIWTPTFIHSLARPFNWYSFTRISYDMLEFVVFELVFQSSMLSIWKCYAFCMPNIDSHWNGHWIDVPGFWMFLRIPVMPLMNPASTLERTLLLSSI